MIFHITTLQEWEKALVKGEYVANSLIEEGFIHCSTLYQTTDTANIFFKGQTGMVILCINEHNLESGIKYESPISEGHHDPDVGTLFPHVYGPINLSAVIKVVKFPPDENGFFSLPNELI